LTTVKAECLFRLDWFCHVTLLLLDRAPRGQNIPLCLPFFTTTSPFGEPPCCGEPVGESQCPRLDAKRNLPNTLAGVNGPLNGNEYRNELFDRGNCCFHHRLFCNDNRVTKMVEEFGGKLLYGHTQQVNSCHGIPADNVTTAHR
jgi:hypothetical protein